MLKLWDRFRCWGKEQIPYVNSHLFSLLAQFFYLWVLELKQRTHCLIGHYLTKREHLGEEDLVTKVKKVYKVSSRNLLTAVHCPANRSRPRKCGRILGNKKRMRLRQYGQWEGRINSLGWLIVFRQKKGHWNSRNSTSRWDFRSQGTKNKCHCSSFCPFRRLHSLPLIILILLVCSAAADNLGFRTCLFCRPSQPLLSNCPPDFPSLSNAHEWLDAIKMGHYKENFDQAGLATFDVISRMTLE